MRNRKGIIKLKKCKNVAERASKVSFRRVWIILNDYPPTFFRKWSIFVWIFRNTKHPSSVKKVVKQLQNRGC